MSELVKIELTEEALQRIIDHTKVHINSTVDDVVDEKLPPAVATKMDKQNPSGTGDMHITGNYYDGTGSIVGASNKLYFVKFYTQMDGSTRKFGFYNSGTTTEDILDHLNDGDIVIAVLEEYGRDPHIYFSDSIAINGYYAHKAHITFDGYVDGNYMYKYILDCDSSVVEGELQKIPIARYDYSTDEKEVGTWIDGTTIYESTIDCGLLWSSMTKTITTQIVVDKIISMEGIASTSTNTIPLPYNGNQINDGQISLNLYKGNNNLLSIGITTFSDRTSYTGYVTVQYTKPSN